MTRCGAVSTVQPGFSLQQSCTTLHTELTLRGWCRSFEIFIPSSMIFLVGFTIFVLNCVFIALFVEPAEALAETLSKVVLCSSTADCCFWVFALLFISANSVSCLLHSSMPNCYTEAASVSCVSTAGTFQGKHKLYLGLDKKLGTGFISSIIFSDSK